MTVSARSPLSYRLAKLIVGAALAAVATAGCADPLDADEPLPSNDEPEPPGVVIDDDEAPTDGSEDGPVSYTFEVDLRVAGQLYVIGRAQYDGAVEVITPSGDVEPFDRWSSERDVHVTGPSGNFIAVMNGDDLTTITAALDLAMTEAGPVCAACGFECRVLAPDELGCQPLCDQCDAQAVLGGNAVIVVPGGPYRDDSEYGDCDEPFDCE